ERRRLPAPEQAEVAVPKRLEEAHAGGLARHGFHGPKAILRAMPDLIRVACVQLTTRADKAANLEKTERLVAKAAAGGADVVLLPEKWNAIGGVERLHEAAETIESGEAVEAMRGWASRHGITLVGGAITDRREGREE